ncbi:prepilin-type N-terminal cleavage/methylation domain-containing protein [Campylobacter upsaliensis]|nr:prepilin-type N-terminal cleavage/methylation domain-containing protein [Campylobacter upsaliensis]EAI9059235.1 prepilin-type N-terminal cleavage/methylation domain-containing protein [Campylobacter upsaliensis]EAJ4502432.1 prepilin-type N-terminal cleavage/methylation domain-containing protein [Campylobacter upsaliensis]EAJ5079082.1 prepilin-type N-terminal cleavage/methylation domain-containing protein [Campylobacter upsaliensis]ECH3612685.1 prepilin-type N-terminal cleavage/methylation do
MKKAFTILELVFVIIILGILAAIALPKLSSSKDEAEISKALNNLRTFINDVSIYALKNDKLANTKLLSNVSGVEEVDLSRNLGDVAFKVGEDERCVEFVFVQGASFVLMGLSTNDNVKNAIKAVANGADESVLSNADFTSSSQNKACVALSKSENFKALANKTYLLLGTR